MRGTEVVSDPTNVLALESARRLREDQTRIVRFCTSHRCVRAQEVPKVPGFAAHFRMFCMTTAGHECQDQAFVTDALTHHIRTHLLGLDRLEQHGYLHKLAANRKLVFVASAIGSQLAAYLYRVPSTAGPAA